jgi:hypothetical protein
VASQTSPFTLAATTLRAKPSLILFATPSAVVPASYCLTDPSGKVMLIITIFKFKEREVKHLGLKKCNLDEIIFIFWAHPCLAARSGHPLYLF